MRRPLLLVLFLGGCKQDPVVQACEDMCDTLVKSCQYDAYPTVESCLTGCAYDADQGGDVEQEAECIVNAGCDVFQIVECQHRFGSNEL